MSRLIAYAVEFAVVAHGSQVRKYTGEPYFRHCAEVALLVSRADPVDEEVIAAAYLHDVVEDTNWGIIDLNVKFGARIAGLVGEVTDVSKPEDGNRAQRKAIDREHFRGASPFAQTIKLADMISNASTITAHDPKFAKIYMHEKLLLLPFLRHGDDRLFMIARDMIEGYYKANADE